MTNAFIRQFAHEMADQLLEIGPVFNAHGEVIAREPPIPELSLVAVRPTAIRGGMRVGLSFFFAGLPDCLVRVLVNPEHFRRGYGGQFQGARDAAAMAIMCLQESLLASTSDLLRGIQCENGKTEWIDLVPWAGAPVRDA